MAYKHISQRRRGFCCNIQVRSIFFTVQEKPNIDRPSFLLYVWFTLTVAFNSIKTYFLPFIDEHLFWRQHESFSGCFLLPAAHRRYLRSQPRLLSGRLGCSPAEQRWTGPQPRDSARPSLGMERNFVCRNQRWVDGLITVDLFFFAPCYKRNYSDKFFIVRLFW